VPDRKSIASQQWYSSYTDSAGIIANGVWRFTFANASAGVKSTPYKSNWITMTKNQWYIIRMRLVADSNNSHQSLLFGFNNVPAAGTQTDIAANVLFGIPTIWTWQETPMLVHGTSTTGIPQFQFKASTAGSVYMDEIQIINAAPTLVDANRYNTRLHYPYGNFDVSSDTMGWGHEIYYGAGRAPAISVSNGVLNLNFARATFGAGQKGIKWTANNNVQGPGHAYTVPINADREVGVRLTMAKQSGNFNSLGIILVAAYGVQTSGQQNFGIAPSNFIAAADVGQLVEGTIRTVGKAINPFYIFQFGLRSDQPGVLTIDDVDLDFDQDDPYYGDSTLFPL